MVEVSSDIRRVVVADDHEIFRQGLCRELNKTCILKCVETCDTFEFLLSAVKKLQVDLVLISMSLVLNAVSADNGVRDVGKIKEISPETSVVWVTHYDSSNFVLSAIAEGADGYLSKGMATKDLINALLLICHGGAVFYGKDIGEIIKNASASAITNGQSLGCGQRLHNRELEVLKLVAEGMSNKVIATRLNISHHTVSNHLENIFSKLNVQSRTAAVLFAIDKDWLPGKRLRM